MYRSWAYILMIVATLVGVVALVWPSPTVRTIEDIASLSRDAAPARAEAPAKTPKAAKAAAAKPAPKPAPPPPPAVAHMPAATTLAKRSAPVLQNGMQPNIFGQPVGTPSPAAPSAGPKPGPPASARPVVSPRPTADTAK